MWAKQVWLKDGQLQTYSSRWEPIWPAPEPVAVTGVSLNESSATIQTEGTLQLTATVTPSDATDKKVTWSSSNDSIAHVDSNWLVTAGSEAGNTTITVTTRDGGFTDTCDITVSGWSEPEVQSVSFADWEEGTTRSVYQSSPDNSAMFLVNPYTASNLHVNVTSSDESIVSINYIDYWDEPQEYGVGYVYFNYNGVGTATITITSEDNPNATSTVYLQVMQDVLVQSVSNLDPSSNNVYLYNNPSSTYNVATFEYYPTNATAVEYGDVVISLKEGETSIGNASIQNTNNWTATIQFYCYDCNVGDSAVYEIYPATDPSTKLELTLTVAEWTESITIDDSQISVNQWSTASRSFTYLPTTSDIGSIMITNDNDSIATASIVKDSDWNGTLYVEWLNEGETTLWIQIPNLDSIEIPVVVTEVQQIPVESISNIPQSAIVVNEWWSNTFTFDYLPANANDFSGISFVDSTYTSTSATYNNWTATVTVEWLNYTTTTSASVWIQLDWVSAWSVDVDVRAYANIVVNPNWAGSVSPSVIYIPYGGATGSSDPTVNPCSIDIYSEPSGTVLNTVTVTATAESWYTFAFLDPALASEWYDPSSSRDVARCDFNQDQ